MTDSDDDDDETDAGDDEHPVARRRSLHRKQGVATCKGLPRLRSERRLQALLGGAEILDQNHNPDDHR